MTSRTVKLAAAWIGALTGLVIVPRLQNEVAWAGICVIILIAVLSHLQRRPAAALPLCSLLGLACTRLTMSLVS